MFAQPVRVLLGIYAEHLYSNLIDRLIWSRAGWYWSNRLTTNVSYCDPSMGILYLGSKSIGSFQITTDKNMNRYGQAEKNFQLLMFDELPTNFFAFWTRKADISWTKINQHFLIARWTKIMFAYPVSLRYTKNRIFFAFSLGIG